MEVILLSGSCAYKEAGIFRGHFKFENSRLAGFRWPLCEIRGRKLGPRICVTAGIHVNEVSSIEAAVRLQQLFDPATMAGSVSIIPVVNQPAYFRYSEYVCPVDNKNINHTFPGRSDGTFSEALCDAIMSEWCADADVYIDMHGGDLRESVAKFVVFQRTDTPETGARARQMATCFDAEIILGLPASYMETSGRPPTAFARQDRVALMSEAGSNGLLDEGAITFHVEGVLNIARRLGIINSPMSGFRNARVLCDKYLWIYSPEDGEFHAEAEPGERVNKGQRLGTIRNLFGDTLAEVVAPGTGYLLWRMTHPSIPKGEAVLTIAVEEEGVA